jgi:hemerythrin-like domain-containing protein
MAATKRTTKSAKAAPRRAKKTVAKKRASSRPANRTGADAIVTLKNDHRTVEQLFKRFEKAGDGARRTKRSLVNSMIAELSVHAAIEELVFYPAVRQEVSDARSDVLEALEEHHLVKVILRELEDLDPANERFDAKVTVLIENVRHHVREEEQELFPMVREELGRNRLRELGDELRAAKRSAPTRPHPGAPDEPPANALVGGAVSVMDRARTVGRRVVDRVVEDAAL